MTSQTKKRYPGQHFQAHHQHDAENDAEDREHRAQRSAEAAPAFRLAIAQDEHRDRDQHKGEQCADIGEVGDRADVEQPAGMPTTNPATQVAKAGVRNWGECGRRRPAAARRATWRTRRAPGRAGRPGSKRPCPSWRRTARTAAPSAESRAAGLQREPLQRVDHRRRVAHHRLPGHNAAEARWPRRHRARVQATSVARMPMGRSRCGFLHSSAAVETESKPM